jgi:hypothetical protein
MDSTLDGFQETGAVSPTVTANATFRKTVRM